MNQVHILLTMDCEPVRAPGRTGQATSGPASYEDSERFIRAYTERAAAYGFPPSFFIHPEVAEAHPEVFLQLEKNAGACLGLHIHPYKLRNTRHHQHFGSLSALEQAAVLSEASAIWCAAIGRRPLYFRPGTFSANDATFEVLTRLGFRGGSLSCPGRLFPDLYAVWTGTPLDPHYANASFRLIEGDLDFVNIPLSVDTSTTEVRGRNAFHFDLRPDYQKADYPKIATNIVAQLKERQPAVPVIVVVTHNDNDFTDPCDRVCANYQAGLEAIVNACKEAGVEPVGGTIDSVSELVRKKLPRASSDFVIGHVAIQAG